jgi:hypothetical protein
VWVDAKLAGAMQSIFLKAFLSGSGNQMRIERTSSIDLSGRHL